MHRAGVGSAHGDPLVRRARKKSRAVSGEPEVGAGLELPGASWRLVRRLRGRRRSEHEERTPRMFSTFFPVARSLGSSLNEEPLCSPLSTFNRSEARYVIKPQPKRGE